MPERVPLLLCEPEGKTMVDVISSRYDINSPILCDRIQEEDEIVENKNARSLVRRETGLFDETL